MVLPSLLSDNELPFVIRYHFAKHTPTSLEHMDATFFILVRNRFMYSEEFVVDNFDNVSKVPSNATSLKMLCVFFFKGVWGLSPRMKKK